MIRKPAPKAQAEIIIADLARQGFDMKRGHALDLVAKLHGYRGWNEFQAATKKAKEAVDVAVAPAPAVAPEISYSPVIAGYFNEKVFIREGSVDIDDRYLVAYLGHHRRDSSTELLSTTLKGETYSLRICGRVRFSVRDSLTGVAKDFRSDDGLTDEYVHALTVARDSEEVQGFDEHPFFEWINGAGDPVGGAFDRISPDPQVEIDKLKSELDELDID